MHVKRGSLLLLLCSFALAQGWGRREAMRPWLQGRFSEAEQQFARMKRPPVISEFLLWEANFEIDRARFGQAAALINEAKKIRTWDDYDEPMRYQARLFLSTGRFAEAYQAALEGSRWNGQDVGKLKVGSVIDLLTLGEVTLASGDFPQAIAILEKARYRAKNGSSIFGMEWIIAQNGIALANMSIGSTKVAAQVASSALLVAERQWGANSVPAMDLLDTIGMIQLSQSDFKNAEVSFSQSRDWREATYGTNHPKVADSYIHAALLSAAQNENADALRRVTHGLEIEKALGLGPNGRWALALLNGADIFAKAGQVDDAKTCYASAIPVLERELGPHARRVENARRQESDLTRR